MSLPATASAEEIEDEILLYNTLIETLDQNEPDYDERRTSLQNELDSLEERLSSNGSNNTSAISFESGSSSLTAPTVNGSSDTSSRPRSPNDGDVPRNKRPLPDDFTPHFAHKNPRSLQASQHAERMKARQLQQWAGWKRQQEQRERDEIFARSLSTQPDLPMPSSSRHPVSGTFRSPPSSNQMQSTLVPPSTQRPANSPLNQASNAPGRAAPSTPLSYSRPQPPATPSSSNVMYAGRTPYHSNALPPIDSLLGTPDRLAALPSRVKSEGSSHQTQPLISSVDDEVIDLTGEEETLIYPPAPAMSTGVGHMPYTSSTMLPRIPSYPYPATNYSHMPARNVGNPSGMPGAFPGASYGPYGEYARSMSGVGPHNPSSLNRNPAIPGSFLSHSPWVTSTANVAQAMRQIENPLASLQNLVNGGSSARFPWNYSDDDDDGYDDDDDDELIYQGTSSGRTYPAGMYTGREDLYRSRYDQIEQYNPEKTREEINALLDNIRPDEELPDELLIQTPEQMNIKLHKYQELGLTWLKKCEEGSNQGGILADDMGLGKTIQMLSLIVSRKSDDPRCKTTLIVAPLALLRQWKQEIENRIKRRFGLTVHTHHGATKKKQFRDLMMYDVVLTTFGSLAQEYGRMEKFRKRQEIDSRATPRADELCTLIHDDCRWYRVILDEAQCIKNKSTLTAKAAFLLKATYRFCMTGTPMMNNVGELYSLIKFLRIRPYQSWEKFRTDIQQPLKSYEDRREAAMQRLQTLCKAIMLRRTKKSQYRGQPILVLPERTTEVDHATFDEDEQSLYNALETKTQVTFNRYLQAGTVGRSYSAILVLLLRLRQACCHPYLIKDLSIAAAADMSSEDLIELANQLPETAVTRIKEANGNFECPICMDAVINPAIFLPCGHDTCRECYVKIADTANVNGDDNRVKARCPHCRGDIDPKKITDFLSFKRVWQPELLSMEEKREYGMLEGESSEGKGKEKAIDDDAETESEEGSTVDEESETESEEEDDEDSDLDGFIVKDGESGDESKSKKKLKRKVEEDDSESKYEAKTKREGKRKVEDAKPDKKAKKSKKKRKSKKKAPPMEKLPKTLTIANLKANARGSSRKKAIMLEKLRESYTDSAKIRQMIALLETVAQNDPTEKILIFSQWTSLLDLCEIAMSPKGWDYRRYDGGMNVTERADAVDDFKDPRKDVRIMLVSLKAGNAGLNLNVASQVIILDPFWNPYIEEQAIDRAHRIGQTRPVRVHRILVPDTVEDRIIAMQDNKRKIIETALDEQQASQLSRLGARELAYLFGITRNANDPVPQR